MIDESALEYLSFDLNQLRPIHLMVNTHHDLAGHWFDMHYQFEVGIVIAGKMKRIFFDHEREIGPGEVWLCGMWEPHGFELIESPCEVVVFVIDPNYISGSKVLSKDILLPFQTAPAHRPTSPKEKFDQIIDLALKAKNLSKEEESDWPKLLLFELFLLLLENWQAPIGLSKDFLLQQSIEGALRLIFQEKRLISTEEAAAACHMSTAKFRSAFKKLMNSSFSSFALEYRLRGALAQLSNSNETQESIAINWGFTDSSHLHKNINKLTTYS